METQNRYFLPIELSGSHIVTYDSSPAHNGWLRHAADFVVPEGTPILAALRGVVFRVKDDSDIGGPTQDFDQFGNYVEIKHANGECSIYEHIQKNSARVKVGEEVPVGTLLANCGTTGWMAHLGAHLHFDVHKYFGPGLNDYESLKINWATPPPEAYIRSRI
jgi:murein DD-endopeptidase MepM/ murein hydrolase activator NlpD